MKSAKTIKAALYNQCKMFIDNRLFTIQNTILEIQESLTSETKSSVGDKHETGRAMLQLEREKAGNQLAEIQKVRETLSKISINNISEIISLGSVVYTSKSNYFIAISAGELKTDNDMFYAISPNTPIGKLLMSKTIGGTITFREQEFIIEEVT